MLRGIGFVLSLAAAAVVEPVLAARIPQLGPQIDLVLLLVVGWALVRGPEPGAVGGLVGGLLQDLLSGWPLGLRAGPKVVVGFVFGLGSQVVHLEGRMVPAVTAALATLTCQAVTWGLVRVLGWAAPLPPFRDLLPAVAVHTLAMPLLFRAVQWHLKSG